MLRGVGWCGGCLGIVGCVVASSQRSLTLTLMQAAGSAVTRRGCLYFQCSHITVCGRFVALAVGVLVVMHVLFARWLSRPPPRPYLPPWDH